MQLVTSIAKDIAKLTVTSIVLADETTAHGMNLLKAEDATAVEIKIL